MKILFLALDINLENKTGDSIHVRELATSLSRVGHEVILISAYSPKRPIKSLQTQENLILYFREHLGKVSELSFYGKIIKKHDPDVIYERRYSAKMGAALSKIHRIPLVVEVNGLVEEEAKILGTAKREFFLIRAFKKWMRKRFFKQARRIVAVSTGIKRGLNERYSIPIEKMTVIPNGANTELFKPMEKDKCKEELGLEVNNKYVSFVGNLVRWQGVDYLIKAAPKVIKEIPNTRFLIIGDGLMRDELNGIVKELKIKDKIIFTGSVPYEQVPVYINASEIGVSIKPPLIPGSPLKVKEYMACGKPVIATKDSDYDFYIVDDAHAGILVTPQNTEDVSRAIIKLLSNPSLNSSMGENGRRYIIENYSWLHVAKNVAEVCKDAIKGRR